MRKVERAFNLDIDQVNFAEVKQVGFFAAAVVECNAIVADNFQDRAIHLVGLTVEFNTAFSRQAGNAGNSAVLNLNNHAVLIFADSDSSIVSKRQSISDNHSAVVECRRAVSYINFKRGISRRVSSIVDSERAVAGFSRNSYIGNFFNIERCAIAGEFNEGNASRFVAGNRERFIFNCNRAVNNRRITYAVNNSRAGAFKRRQIEFTFTDLNHRAPVGFNCKLVDEYNAVSNFFADPDSFASDKTSRLHGVFSVVDREAFAFVNSANRDSFVVNRNADCCLFASRNCISRRCNAVEAFSAEFNSAIREDNAFANFDRRRGGNRKASAVDAVMERRFTALSKLELRACSRAGNRHAFASERSNFAEVYRAAIFAGNNFVCTGNVKRNSFRNRNVASRRSCGNFRNNAVIDFNNAERGVDNVNTEAGAGNEVLRAVVALQSNANAVADVINNYVVICGRYETFLKRNRVVFKRAESFNVYSGFGNCVRVGINHVNRQFGAVKYCVVSAGIKNRRVAALFSTKSNSAGASGNVIEVVAVAVDRDAVILSAVVGNLNSCIFIETSNISNNAVSYGEGERLIVAVGDNFKCLVANRVGYSISNRENFNREGTHRAGNSSVSRHNVGNFNRAVRVANRVAAVVNAELRSACNDRCAAFNINCAAFKSDTRCAGNVAAAYSKAFSRFTDREGCVAADNLRCAVRKAGKFDFCAFANRYGIRSVTARSEHAFRVNCSGRRLVSVDEDCIFSVIRNFNRLIGVDNYRVLPSVSFVVNDVGEVCSRRASKNLVAILNQANASLFVFVSGLAFGNVERFIFVAFACAVEVCNADRNAFRRLDINFSAGSRDSSLASRYAVGIIAGGIEVDNAVVERGAFVRRGNFENAFSCNVSHAVNDELGEQAVSGFNHRGQIRCQSGIFSANLNVLENVAVIAFNALELERAVGYSQISNLNRAVIAYYNSVRRNVNQVERAFRVNRQYVNQSLFCANNEGFSVFSAVNQANVILNQAISRLSVGILTNTEAVAFANFINAYHIAEENRRSNIASNRRDNRLIFTGRSYVFAFSKSNGTADKCGSTIFVSLNYKRFAVSRSVGRAVDSYRLFACRSFNRRVKVSCQTAKSIGVACVNVNNFFSRRTNSEVVIAFFFASRQGCNNFIRNVFFAEAVDNRAARSKSLNTFSKTNRAIFVNLQISNRCVVDERKDIGLFVRAVNLRSVAFNNGELAVGNHGVGLAVEYDNNTFFEVGNAGNSAVFNGYSYAVRLAGNSDVTFSRGNSVDNTYSTVGKRAVSNRRRCNYVIISAIDSVSGRFFSREYEGGFAGCAHASAVQSYSLAKFNSAFSFIRLNNDTASREFHYVNKTNHASYRSIFSVGNSAFNGYNFQLGCVDNLYAECSADVRQTLYINRIVFDQRYSLIAFGNVRDNNEVAAFFGRYKTSVDNLNRIRFGVEVEVRRISISVITLFRNLTVFVNRVDGNAGAVEFNVEGSAFEFQRSIVAVVFAGTNSAGRFASLNCHAESAVVDSNRVFVFAVVGNFNFSVNVETLNRRNRVVSNLEAYAVIFVRLNLEGLVANSVSDSFSIE